MPVMNTLDAHLNFADAVDNFCVGYRVFSLLQRRHKLWLGKTSVPMLLLLRGKVL